MSYGIDKNKDVYYQLEINNNNYALTWYEFSEVFL